ncbi:MULTISPECIES: caspase family protein [unclassified Variovorax]|uniref:caspase family protein n=1 Tax=unclassified Variovorax TaxID=663243 RepID=UPI001BD5F31C|nr:MULTISPECIES: caspase family protein [unclassified Variovorax]
MLQSAKALFPMVTTVCLTLASFHVFAIEVVNQKTVHRLALSIGNEAYAANGFWTKLFAPKRDAVDIGEMFKRAGFKVTVETDLDSKNLRKTIENFIYEVETVKRDIRNRNAEDSEAVVALFFYSGHGFALNDSPYLPGTDATGTQLEDVVPKSYRLAQLVNFLTPKDNDVDFLSVLMIDACRQTIQLPSRTSGQKGATFAAKTFADIGGVGRIAIFAAVNGRPSYDAREGVAENSVFTQAIKDAANDPSALVSFSQFVSYVERRTPEISKARFDVRQFTEVQKVGVENDFLWRKTDEAVVSTKVSALNQKGIEEPSIGFINVGQLKSSAQGSDAKTIWTSVAVAGGEGDNTKSIKKGDKITLLTNPIVSANIPQKRVVCFPARGRLLDVAPERCTEMTVVPAIRMGTIPKGLEVTAVENSVNVDGQTWVKILFDRKAPL